ncbi:serine hydrolase [Schumannella sp. 10F1B-5-1]|uniref:serine hydrolase domain-containing protein n=1 Tax=Schumannella sp. 10F1B-5-1 TaxID=2590780 RepID=UPI0011321E96|nr:serine hydrolase domain-containing protein [Schumannella sp. 10F1B-5-1]TPW70047.1 beta-lactamase family protein [Schumannella sp. 10F1B-5-1]
MTPKPDRTPKSDRAPRPSARAAIAAQRIRLAALPRPTALIAVLLAVAVLVAGVVLAPWGPRLAERTDWSAGRPGADDALATQVERIVAGQGSAFAGQRYHHLVALRIDGDGTAVAGWGADGDTEFEIGSVTKTFTASLFAEALRRGEVTEDQEVGTLLDLGDAPVADATLAELASHRSGLPVQPGNLAALGRNYWGTLTASDSFQVPLATLLDEARQAPITDRGTYLYSNLGVALLGQALAAAADTDYRDLLQTRILDPLGLDATTLPEYSRELPADAPRGYTATGRPNGEWTLGPFAPAGGIRSTATDMESWARAVLDGSAPGTDPDPQGDAVDLTKPRWKAGESRIGYIWHTTEADGRTLTWHNGETGGFHSIVIVDRERDSAIVVLSDVAGGGVDELGFALIMEEER